MCALSTCTSTCMPGACEVQKWFGLLELELQMVMDHHVGSEN